MLHYTACLASSFDGKIAPAHTHQYVRIGSDRDISHLIRLRGEFDALLMGGSTFRAYPKRHKSEEGSHRPIHAILTRGGDNILAALPPESPLFKEQSSDQAVPIVVFAQRCPSIDQQAKYPDSIQWVETGETALQQLNIIDQTLHEMGCSNGLVEGGGQIMALFLEAKALREMYLTLCPLFLGGQDAPNLLSGTEFQLKDAPRMELMEVSQQGHELFLRVTFQYT